MKAVDINIKKGKFANEVKIARLAIVCTHAAQYNIHWIMELARSGVKVRVFYTYKRGPGNLSYEPDFAGSVDWGMPMYEGYDCEFVPNKAKLPSLNRFSGVKNPDLVSRIEAWGASAVLVVGWNYWSHLKTMVYFHGRIPILFRGDSTLTSGGKYPAFLRFFALRTIYKFVDRFLYVGKKNLQYYRRCGVPDSKLVHSPHVVDNSLFRISNEGCIKALLKRTELGIKEKELVVLFVGKFIEVKNPMFVLKLARACTGLPIRFLMVGDGPMRDGLLAAAAWLKNIHFLGFKNQAEMPAVYHMSDLLIAPSLSETWGLCINEAMAAGIPVMVSDKAGCVADLVLENITGITFDPGDQGKVFSFLLDCLGRRSRLDSMAAACQNKIRDFSVDNLVRSIKWALEECERQVN